MPTEELTQYRLSPSQRRLWSLSEDFSLRRVSALVRLRGSLDVERLRRAVAEVVAGQEILRTRLSLPAWSKTPVQEVGEEPSFGWRVLAAEDPEAAPGTEWPLEAAADPSMEPLECTLIPGAPGEHLFALSLSPFCADAPTLGLLMTEIERAYAGRPVDEEGIDYCQFSEWQHELVEEDDGDLRLAAAYWSRQGREEGPTRPLPGARSEPGPFQPRALSLSLAADLGERLRPLAGGDVPLRTVLLAAWQVLLGHLGARRDPTLGCLFEVRAYPEIASGFGPFSRVLPLRVGGAPDQGFRAYVARVAEAEREAEEWQDYAVEAGAQEDGFPLYFEWRRWPAEVGGEELRWTMLRQEAWGEPFSLGIIGAEVDGRPRVELVYDAGRWSTAAAEAWADRLAGILEQVAARPEIPLGDLELVTGTDRERLRLLHGAATGPARDEPLLLRFEEQATLRPEEEALADARQCWTYGELDREANQLAHRLLRMGVGPEQPVALRLERSAAFVLAMLGVWKAGGCYLPLDPALPAARAREMLAGAGVSLLVVEPGAAVDDLAAPERVLELDPRALSPLPSHRPEVPLHPEGLAYVLFTSGSTGRPKGVAVEHRQVSHYLAGLLRRIPASPGLTYATVSTFAADLGNSVIFPSLATGGRLRVVEQELVGNALALGELFERWPIDVLKIVPSHLEALLAGGEAAQILPRRVLILGGEAASPALLEKLREAPAALRILNHYGPTETTVGVVTHPISAGQDHPVPLGLPFEGCLIRLADAGLRLVPPEVPGEILIGGGQLARGYLGKGAWTAERWIPDAAAEDPGRRLYRSGDLGCLAPSGELEFLGRIDHQVKVRGFRIELGEVESALRRHPQVAECVATLWGGGREGRLVAYVTLRSPGGVSAADLRAALSLELPEHMLPASVEILETMPLDSNGKIARRALPEPGSGEASYVPPRNPVEERLAAIWTQVLGVEKVGVDDNFFERGGDSILVIQAVARAGRAGLRLTPKQFFDHQTIAELATLVEDSEPRGEREEASGEVPLTPIVHWFFEQEFASPEHWNWALLQEVLEPLDPAHLEAVLARVLEQHDLLRSRFEPGHEGWVHRVEAIPGDPPFHQVDLSALVEGDRGQVVEAVAARAQRSLNLDTGPLLRLLHCGMGTGRPARLLMVVHHLVIDGVSWRVLLEDLRAALGQLRRGEEISLPAKTSPYRHWARRLRDEVRAGAFDGELELWREILGSRVDPLPEDGPGGANTVASERTVQRTLDREQTEALLREVPKAYRTQVGDALLAALGRTLWGWTGQGRHRIELEGHGREDLFDDVDISRTVGWFTSHYPVLLDVEPEEDPGGDLRRVKETLRRIPRHGIGFGLLRLPSAREAAAELPSVGSGPELSFNYLGQFDTPGSESSLFGPAAESPGPSRSPLGHRRSLLAVVARISEGELRITWRFSAHRHRLSTIEELADSYVQALGNLVRHCRQTEAGFTPSDFGLATGLSQDELERIARRVGQAKE